MTQRDDLDRMLTAWLDDPYTPPAPRYLGQVLERTRHTRQRPAWASLERWLPMADKVLQPTTAPPMRLAWVLLIALLVVAVAAVAVVGSRLLASSTIPQGGAAVFTFGSISGQTTTEGHLDRPRGRHGPAPADQRTGHQVAPRVLAGRHAHRLPLLGERDRFDRRHRRGWRPPDHAGHDPGVAGGVHPGRARVVAGREEPHLPDQSVLRQPGRPLHRGHRWLVARDAAHRRRDE